MFKSRDIRFYPGDNYDKEVKSKVNDKPKRFSFQPPRTKRPDAATYIPPPRLEPTADENNQESSEEDDLPKTLFIFEFEDKDGKVYKQYVKEGVRAELLAQRMGYDRKLTPGMIQALQDRLQEEMDKRTKKPNS